MENPKEWQCQFNMDKYAKGNTTGNNDTETISEVEGILVKINKWIMEQVSFSIAL